MGLSQQKLNEKKEYFIFKIKKKLLLLLNRTVLNEQFSKKLINK
jgi:hypothetical protein